MIWDRWAALERETQLVCALVVGFVLYRTGVASLSGFGFHQGWNEGHYALIARGFLDHPLVPYYADRYVYSVPPLFPYAITGSYLAFGQSVLATRLPSIFAGGGVIGATYALGVAVCDDRRTALVGALVLAVVPYVQLYGGRAQTDMLMVCLVTASLAAIVRGYQRDRGLWLAGGGVLFAAAVAAKQPAILLAPIVLFWLLGNRQVSRERLRQTGLLIGASAIALLPLAGWLALNYVANPAAFVTDWEHELFSRTAPFANVPLLLSVAFSLGMTPLVLLAGSVGVVKDVAETYSGLAERATDAGPSVLTWWLLVYGAFVFARTPQGHQYYAVVLTPPIALFAAHGIDVVASLADRLPTRREAVHLGLVGIVVLSSLAGTAVLFELSGEFSAAEGGGTHVAADSGAFVSEEVPDTATVLVENGYGPPMRWYVRDDFPVTNVDTYHVADLDGARLRSAARESDGPVYVVVPVPAWGEYPNDALVEVHRTETYEYTVMSVLGSQVDTDSKFSFYLNDRGLVIYRLDKTALEPTRAS